VFDCGVNEDEHVAVVRPRGALDLHSAAAFREALRRASSPLRHVVVDLADLHYIDSGGIHVLLVYAHLCRERARRFLLARPRAHVQRVMEIVDTHRRLAVAASVEGAVEEIAARAAESG
jgi:anti-sigma B factor antagonist